jgi:hypothetical protein
MENYGLPCGDIYESHWGGRPIGPRPGDDFGSLTNAWCSDLYDTALEFCLMILDVARYNDKDISNYLPLIDSCVTFFDQHYRYENKRRTGSELNSEGELVLYPGSACETYKDTTNASSTISALRVVLSRLMELPGAYSSTEQRRHWQDMENRLPPLPLREMNGHQTIAPAKSWSHIQNQEFPQMYPVFPWGLYGVGKADAQLAIDTYRYGADRTNQHGVNGWKQDPIFAARLGMTREAQRMISEKLSDARARFPTFWGPNFDWTPDFNHGGSGAIALQEMLLQTDDTVILLFPAWPKDWDVHFKLCAPYNTVVEAVVKSGKVKKLIVTPTTRIKDLVLLPMD